MSLDESFFSRSSRISRSSSVSNGCQRNQTNITVQRLALSEAGQLYLDNASMCRRTSDISGRYIFSRWLYNCADGCLAHNSVASMHVCASPFPAYSCNAASSFNSQCLYGMQASRLRLMVNGSKRFSLLYHGHHLRYHAATFAQTALTQRRLLTVRQVSLVVNLH